MRKMLLAAAAALLLVAGSIGNGASAADKLKVGFIYLGPVGDLGWTYQHYLARKALEQELGDKIEIVALSKIDAMEASDLKKQKDRLKRAAKQTPLLLSSISGAGVPEALRALIAVIGEAPVSVKAKGAARAEPWATPSA